jgi:hypothetical protein
MITTRSHRDDPITSHEAARKAQPFAEALALRILAVFNKTEEPLAAHDVAEILKIDLIDARRRVTDLHQADYIMVFDTCGVTPKGCRCRRYVATLKMVLA